jgi:hypothetical protein
MDNWIESEFASIDIGDKRLNNRAQQILNNLSSAPGRTIPQTFLHWNEIKACYRFFDNPTVTYEKLLNPHRKEVIERIKKESIVLFPTDTSILDYSSKNAMGGKGRIQGKNTGFFLHATLAITPERLNLGVIDSKIWTRDFVSETSSNPHRDDLPIEKKESFRWLESYRNISQIAESCSKTQFIYIADREADIVELLGEASKEKANGKNIDVLIRSQHDRQIDIKDPKGDLNKPYEKLRQKLKSSPSLGTIKFTIPATTERKSREVVQAIKTGTLIIRTKKYNGNDTQKITINAVMAIEESNTEDSLCWIFLTTLPVKTFEQGCRVVEFYLCRWEIEVFFKVLKSGCKVEERQLETSERLKPLIALFLVLSWRIMYVMMLGRLTPDISCGDIFADAEWKSVFKILNRKEQIPDKPPSLNEFIIMIANLGGYVEGKNALPPGVKVMWRGMSRMKDFALAWEAFA